LLVDHLFSLCFVHFLLSSVATWSVKWGTFNPLSPLSLARHLALVNWSGVSTAWSTERSIHHRQGNARGNDSLARLICADGAFVLLL
jgi:hypothetical protein